MKPELRLWQFMLLVAFLVVILGGLLFLFEITKMPEECGFDETDYIEEHGTWLCNPEACFVSENNIICELCCKDFGQKRTAKIVITKTSGLGGN